MATKSLVKSAQITVVGAAHNCKANKRHRLKKGDIRLTVKEGQSTSHYCVCCGLKILDRSIKKLTSLQTDIKDS